MSAEPVVISIDPPMSRDLDDAIAAIRTSNGGWIVDACVPDVPFLVVPGSAADIEARERVVTRYGGSFIRQGMLPEEAVSALSLSPTKATPMCWFRLELGEGLAVTDVRIRRIQHRTFARMTYLEADGALSDRGHPRHREISSMWELAMALHARRRIRTGAAFDPEHNLYTTEEGLIARLDEKESHRTHLLVMEIMILVNEALAIHARDNGIPVIYRNHRPRDASSGLREDVVREMRAADGLSSEAAAERLRDLASRIGPATFGSRPEGHWGLDVPAYAWFTSPLRRYCDIVNLRALVHGVHDEDADATARAIDAGTRMARESTSLHHGMRSRAQIARTILAGDAIGLAEWDMHTILRACVENDIVDRLVDEEVLRRMDAGKLTGKDMESVYTHGRKTLEEATIDRMTDWLLSDAQRQIVMARDMVMRQRITCIPTLAGGRPDVHAAMVEISAMLGFSLPADQGRPASDDRLYDKQGDPVIEHPNPKGALLELAAARKALVRFAEKGRVGPSHQPRFTVEAVWSLDGTEIQSEASASTMKAAERAAAWDMLQKIPPTSAPAPEKGGEKPAKSLLLEHASRTKGVVTFSPAVMEGPPHQPTFRVEAQYVLPGRRVNGDGSGGSRKEAERRAAEAILEQL